MKLEEFKARVGRLLLEALHGEYIESRAFTWEFKGVLEEDPDDLISAEYEICFAAGTKERRHQIRIGWRKGLGIGFLVGDESAQLMKITVSNAYMLIYLDLAAREPWNDYVT